MSEQEELPDAQAYATNTNANPAMGMGTYNLTFHANGGTTLNPNPTLCNPGGTALQWNSYTGAQWVNPTPIQFVPSNAFPTPESLREFVEQCTAKYLDEKLDERVGKALDELARAFNENKAFKPNPFYVETPGSEHAV